MRELEIAEELILQDEGALKEIGYTIKRLFYELRYKEKVIQELRQELEKKNDGLHRSH